MDWRSFRLAAVHEMIGNAEGWKPSSDPAERDVRDVCYGLVRLHAGLFTLLACPEGALPAGEGASAQELLLDVLRRLDETSVAAAARRC